MVFVKNAGSDKFNKGNKHYCYVHGYTSHKGTACSVMLADPVKYMHSHQQASSHTMSPG